MTWSAVMGRSFWLQLLAVSKTVADTRAPVITCLIIAAWDKYDEGLMLRSRSLLVLALEEGLDEGGEEEQGEQSGADLSDQLGVMDRSGVEGHRQLVCPCRDIGCTKRIVGTYQRKLALAVKREVPSVRIVDLREDEETRYIGRDAVLRLAGCVGEELDLADSGCGL